MQDKQKLKDCIPVRYNIFGKAVFLTPKPGKGTEFVKFILSKASPDMREALLPMVFPALAAHLADVTFTYSDNKNYEMCGQMGHLIGQSGIGKAQLTCLIEAVMRGPRKHDEEGFKRHADWQKQVKTRAANKEKPEEPEVAYGIPLPT